MENIVVNRRVTEKKKKAARGGFVKPTNLSFYPFTGDLIKEDAWDDTASFFVWCWQLDTADRTLDGNLCSDYKILTYLFCNLCPYPVSPLLHIQMKEI